jgi:hypothetical protein
VYISTPSLADEADGSEFWTCFMWMLKVRVLSLRLESFKCLQWGKSFQELHFFREKMPATLNHELSLETEAEFP